ncbi:MAG: hypothetical protein ACRCXZ_01040, partial [Patescibacteria group bacterium]
NKSKEIGDRYKNTKYPFLIIPQGFKLPYTSEKDKKINKTRKLDRNTNDITKYNQKPIEAKAQQEESNKINEELQKEFNAGKGTCFDNNHKLFGIRIDNETIINDKHSSGYNISPETDDIYNQAINPENKKIETGTTNNTSFLNSGIPTIKIYSNSNELSNLSDTLESICWNRISCERRDVIMSRSANNSFDYPNNPLTKGKQNEIIKTNQEERNKQEAQDLEKRNNPYKDQKVKLWYTVHCDNKAEFEKSEIPAPILEGFFEQSSNDAWDFTVYGKAIHKGTPIELHVWEKHNCNRNWLGYDSADVKYNVYPITHEGIEHVRNSLYADTLALKDEDLGQSWSNDQPGNQIELKIR